MDRNQAKLVKCTVLLMSVLTLVKLEKSLHTTPVIRLKVVEIKKTVKTRMSHLGK